MSAENVKAFVEKARKDPEFQKKMKTLSADPQSAMKKIIQWGKESGYHFSEQDWMNHRKQAMQSGELKEADLAKVSGGTLMTTEALTITIVANVTIQVCTRH